MKRVFGLAMLGFAPALPAAFSADGITPGNWKMVVPAPTANVERTELLLKLDAKDGKTTATLIAPTPSDKAELVSFAMTGDRVRIVAKTPVHVVFQGRLTKDGKKIMGVSDDGITLRAAYMVPTDMTKIEANDKTHKLNIDQFDKAMQLANAASALTGKVRQTKDNDEKVKLGKLKPMRPTARRMPRFRFCTRKSSPSTRKPSRPAARLWRFCDARGMSPSRWS